MNTPTPISSPREPAHLERLLHTLQTLHADVLAFQDHWSASVHDLEGEHYESALNLLHYLALRRYDLSSFPADLEMASLYTNRNFYTSMQPAAPGRPTEWAGVGLAALEKEADKGPASLRRPCHAGVLCSALTTCRHTGHAVLTFCHEKRHTAPAQGGRGTLYDR